MHRGSHDRWPMLGLGSWLWAIEHSHLRVYLALTSLVAPTPTQVYDPAWGTVEIPAGCAATSLDRLASHAGVSRDVVRGALRVLAAGPVRNGTDPAISYVSKRGGYSLITLHAHCAACIELRATQATTLARCQRCDQVSATTQVIAVDSGEAHSDDHTDDHTGARTRISSILPSPTVANVEIPSRSIDLPVSADTLPHSARQDFLREPPIKTAGTQPALFPDSDPGSSTDLGSSSFHRTIVGTSGSTAADRTGPVTAPESLSAGKPVTDAQAKARAKADRVPDQAWKASDYLRAKVLDENPNASLAAQPWGADRRTGLRLKWADEMRLIVDHDKHTYTSIKLRVDWLFGGQKSPLDRRLVVQSPDALRRKWDQITAAMKREAAAAEPRVAPPRPSSVMKIKREEL